MKRTCMAAKSGGLALVLLLCWHIQPASAQDAAQQPSYTIPEYNGFQACRAETNPQAQVKCLDDFAAKFPKSTLMKYVDQLYVGAYNTLKNYPKTIEYADKFVAESDAKADGGGRLQSLYMRSLAFNLSYSASTSQDDLKKARDAAQAGLDALNGLPKPANMTDAQFDEQKKAPTALFNYTAGFASLYLKDYKAAETSFKAALAANPQDGVTYFRLGVAYLSDNPAQSMDGFWALARAIGLKAQGSDQIKDYLRKRLIVYQQSGCDNLIDPQMNELLQLAASSADRPATYNIPSSADLDKVRASSNILSVLTDLKGGGDKAKLTWLAICGSEFPEVVGKVIEVTPGTDTVELHVFTGATPEEMEAATTANMDVKVVGQPEASRLQKDDGARFSGTLAGYDPEPFMLHWDKAKVNPEDIPAEKGGQRKPHKVAPKSQ